MSTCLGVSDFKAEHTNEQVSFSYSTNDAHRKYDKQNYIIAIDARSFAISADWNLIKKIYCVFIMIIRDFYHDLQITQW